MLGTIRRRSYAKRMARFTWRKVWAHDIGVDLGTANTLVYVRGRGIVIDEPSVVAINQRTKQVIAIGKPAKQMVGKTPQGVIAARPLIDGVVSDFEITEEMLKSFVARLHNEYSVMWPRPRMVIGLPSGVTEVEKRAVEEAARNAGARAIYLVEEPMAAAIGCGLPVKEPTGSMIVDIGGGTTEVAVIALGGIVVSRSLRIAGDELTEAVMQHLRDEFNLAIGESTAERIKLQIGGVGHENKSRKIVIRGRHLLTGLPQEMKLGGEHVRLPLMKNIRPIVEAVRMTLEEAPPELVGDIMQRGILLTGGGALLGGLDKLIAQETHMPVRVVPNALTAVVEGTGQVLEDLDSLKEVLIGRGEPA
jgi:rod shape-determining protein MreB